MKYLLIFCLIISVQSKAQKHLLSNEKRVFSFQTKKGKYMTLAKDSANKYIVYRFGTKDTVEFEYPEKNRSSWSKFKYGFYLRGGGVQNEGEDRNYIYFSNKNIRYTIYDTYYAIGSKSFIGIKVLDPGVGKPIDIRGEYRTKQGTMIDFRDNKLLEILEDTE
ncbi:MAG TPA: hypothetical protein VGZ90_14695 [Puia sp.]|jgi:hypothetical protein|nr:hypothetical protein [Puia sp.]